MTKKKSEMQFATIVKKRLRLGMARKDARAKGYISSLGTARAYSQCLKNYAAWRNANGLPVGEQDNLQQIQIYFSECAATYSQSTLDQSRGALQLFFNRRLARVFSHVESVLATRAYSQESVFKILARLSDKNALATLISHQSGARAHELATLRRVDELCASAARNWDPRRFLGMPAGRKYLVTGKGGLRREIWIPEPLADELERHRFLSPQRVVDRGIFYDAFYDIGFGQAFSQSFASASVAALGFSTGAHGLRHAYVKKRTATLMKLDFSFCQAQSIVSQEVGHFRPSITLAYYR